MTISSNRLARISADTGLSVNESESYLDQGLINFDKQTGRYFVDHGDTKKPIVKQRPKRYLTREELRWLTK